MLFAEIVGFVLFVGSRAASPTGPGRTGGDFPAFYAAGRIVNAGEGARLYDADVQAAAQVDILPRGPAIGDQPGAAHYCHFAYPPFFAVFYAPLARLPFLLAWVVHTVLMFGALAAAIWLIRRRLPALVAHRASAFAAAATFYPLARGMFGGQNTALSLLCAAGAFAARSDVACGAWLGLWLFKPQYALPVIAAVALARPRVLLGVAPVAALVWAVAAAVSGPDWTRTWVAAAARFAELDHAIDGWNATSLYELVIPFGPTGGATPVAGVLSVATATLLMLGLSRARPTAAIPLAACLAPLIAPHALFYDAGLAVLGASLLGAASTGTIPAGTASRELGPVVLLWLAGFCVVLPGPWGTALCVAGAVCAWRGAGSDQPKNEPSN